MKKAKIDLNEFMDGRILNDNLKRLGLNIN